MYQQGTKGMREKKSNSKMKSNPCHQHQNGTKIHFLFTKCHLSTPFQLWGYHLIFKLLPEIHFNLFTTQSKLVLQNY